MTRKIIQVGNICALCQEKYPSSVLYTCSRCGLMYCGNCIILEDHEIICLRCAVREVRPKRRENKYMKLGKFLLKKAKATKEVALSFKEIEAIIEDKLPETAKTRRSWWSNVRGRMPSEAWLTFGWRVEEVDLNEGKVKFVREAGVEKEPKEPEEHGEKKTFKALAFKAKAKAQKKRLSKTRIAMLQARLKNIERQRMGHPSGS